MCGICGIVSIGGVPIDEILLQSMMQTMKHRGPDDSGVFIKNNVGLGFVRLSILDLSSHGHQPMLSEDKRYVIVFNGEIFNYLELKDELKLKGYRFYTNTDTEVLINSYIEWGEQCQHKFNGMWSFVIYDTQKDEIFVSRDRYGIKPFYYLKSEGQFIFASEIKPLLKLLEVPPTPDHQSIFDYLIYNRTDQTNRTFFNEIKKLQHGQNLIISKNQVAIKKWYSLNDAVNLAKGFSSTNEFKSLFIDAINLRLRSDVPVGVCLSGGLDSSSIVSVLINCCEKKDLNTFSAVYSPNQFGDESEYIKLYESKLENVYYTYPDSNSLYSDLRDFVKAQEEPIPSTGPYAQFKVMELAKKHVTVTLDGQGADEMLAGYHYFFGYYFKELLKRGHIINLFKELYFYLANHKSIYGLKTFIYLLLPQTLKATSRISEKGYLLYPYVNKYKHNKTITKNLYGSKSLKDALLDHFEFKLEHLLKWEDKNSMWFSIEARVPYLDHRLVEKMLASDSKMFINKGVTKIIVRESMKGLIPEKIRKRQDKMGFGTPQDEWFRTPIFQKLIFELLNSEKFKNRGIINSSIAIQQYKKHLKKEINISKEIWKWIHLELWFRLFIDSTENELYSSKF